MTRLMVKNLPLNTTEASLRKIFNEYGTVTDCRLLHRQGLFRGLAFVGYSCTESCTAAIEALNGTYILTRKISVQPSLTHVEVVQQAEAKRPPKPEHPSPSFQDFKNSFAIPEELEEDETFQRFVQLHMPEVKTSSWKNRDMTEKNLTGKTEHQVAFEKAKLAYVFDGESDSDEEPARTADDAKLRKEPELEAPKDTLASQAITDMEYMKGKTGETKHLDSDDEDDTPSGAEVEREASDAKNQSQTEMQSENDSLSTKDEDCKHTNEEPDKSETESKDDKRIPNFYKAKMWPLPMQITAADVRRALKGKVNSIKFNNKTVSGKSVMAILSFDRKFQLEAALALNEQTLFTHKKVLIRQLKTKEPAKINMKSKNWNEDTLDDIEPIVESGRLFVINLPFTCAEEDLESLFSQYGELVQVFIPLDGLTGRMKGFAHVTYQLPENAVTAFNTLNCTAFQGRVLHIFPGRPIKSEMINEPTVDPNDYKKLKAEKAKKEANSSHNWNTLFLGGNAVADAMADRYKVAKSDLLAADQNVSLGVRMALGETEIVNETREFLTNAGISLETFQKESPARSRTVILVKNLPFGVTVSRLEDLFSPFGTLGRVVMPPTGITAVVEFQEPHDAKKAFMKLAYKRFDHVPLYLEWAPIGVFKDHKTESSDKSEGRTEDDLGGKESEEKGPAGDSTVSDSKESKSDGSTSKEQAKETVTDGITLFVKNLNFNTVENHLVEHFKRCGKVISAVIARKSNPKDPKNPLSMGYGFVKFANREQATEALKTLQHSTLKDHKLEISMSQRKTGMSTRGKKNTVTGKEQTGCKLVVRNIPFQAKQKEIKELFEVFGELADVRIPKSVKGTHKGFGFIEYTTQEDAKRAFEAVYHSTHLYGRRLVLEWADSQQETIESLRRKTANTFMNETPSAKRSKAIEIRQSISKLAKEARR